MSSNTDNRRPWWVVPVISFLVGLLIGWWVIGWLLWPVNWTNALPADLRATERDAYLSMVAESYAASRNANVARERLSSFSAQELSQYLANLQSMAAANPQQASQVQALVDLVGPARPAVPGAATATRTPVSAARPASGASAAAPNNLLSKLRSAATVLLWLLLLAAAVVVVYYLWRRLRAAYSTEPRPAVNTTIRQPRPPISPQRSLDEIAQDAKARWPGSYTAEPAGTEVTVTEQEEPAPPAPISAPPLVPAPPKPIRTPTAGAASASARVAEFRALYQVGEPDYDEAFDIVDPTGGYLGQCGLELNDPVGRSHDQAAALQAWLWDTNDPDTKVMVLMSEGAYRDTAMRDQLKGEHEALPVRTGTEFALESYKVLLRGYVDKAEYVEQDPPYTIFSELLVRFQIYKKA